MDFPLIKNDKSKSRKKGGGSLIKIVTYETRWEKRAGVKTKISA